MRLQLIDFQVWDERCRTILARLLIGTDAFQTKRRNKSDTLNILINWTIDDKKLTTKLFDQSLLEPR